MKRSKIKKEIIYIRSSSPPQSPIQPRQPYRFAQDLSIEGVNRDDDDDNNDDGHSNWQPGSRPHSESLSTHDEQKKVIRAVAPTSKPNPNNYNLHHMNCRMLTLYVFVPLPFVVHELTNMHSKSQAVTRRIREIYYVSTLLFEPCMKPFT